MYCRNSMNNGSVCILAKTTLNAAELDVTEFVEPWDKHFDFAALDILNRHMNAAIFVIYRTPNAIISTTSFKYIFLNAILHKYGTIIIRGDLKLTYLVILQTRKSLMQY